MEGTMKKIVRFLAVPLLLVLVASTGFGWGNATHTHFSKQLGAHYGFQNLHEMYGAVLVDGFNLVLSDTGQFIYDKLHHDPMAMFAAAHSCEKRATAFGFVSHNDNWGADWTAHHHAMTLSGGGYAVLKGMDLASAIQPVLFDILIHAGVRSSLAESLSYGLAPELGHDLAETAVDLMVKRQVDPAIGGRILAAAQFRPSSVPDLLCDAYAQMLVRTFRMRHQEARAYIAAVEAAYRDQMIQYGQMFLLPEEQTVLLLAQMNAAIAGGYLEYYAAINGDPREITVTTEQAETFIRGAMTAVQGDYRHELNATLAYLCREMQRRNIRTCRPFGKEGEPLAEASEFSLNENFPNPFNPSTTLSFNIPSTANISLDIYNIIGQKVKTLIDGKTYEEGTWEALWDGMNDAGTLVPSGTYFSRLITPSGVFTRKMLLLK
jgi:hypothetical protein